MLFYKPISKYMKRIISILFVLSTATSRGSDSPTKIFQPVVPNKIPDKFIPAYHQNFQGLLGFRLDVNLQKRLLQIDSAIILSGFRKRPGSQTWIGEHVGKFLFSASNTYKYSHDSHIKQLLDAMVKEYIVCQLPDGYLGTYLPKDYWTDWDVWAHKYAILGLLNYYSVTGDHAALETAKKCGDLLCRTFGDEPGQRDIMVAGHHAGMAPGSVLEPMVDLYRFTGDKKYLQFCEYILRAYEHPNGPKIISSLEKYGDVTKVGNGKAYEMMSCFLGILKYYKLSGNVKYLNALERAWSDIRLHRMYITGTSSFHEHFIGDDLLMAENESSMGEGCVTTTWIQFNLQLLQITGEQKYADELERSVYNHLLAAENPRTGCVSYYTALQGKKPYKCDQGYSCCLSSVPRGISLIPDMVWGKVDNNFSVLMYEAGEVTDTIITKDLSSISLNIKSTTNFPLDGQVRYVITPSQVKNFILNFRVPAWSRNFVAKVGNEIYRGTTGQFLKIARTWKAGDELSITFDMPLQVIPGGLSYPNQIAFKRGPQVLAVDHALNANVSSISKLQVSNDQAVAIDMRDKLPSTWAWKQAYAVQLDDNHQRINVMLVPFAEAGQTGDEVEVWIDAPSRLNK
jgi:DUF1680 family protein